MPTGILETIPPSGVWKKVDVTERPDLDLRVFDTPWGSALEGPETVFQLSQDDIRAGFASWLHGGLEEARKLFGDHCTAGKLGVVKKEGADPCLIGDNTVSNANQLCRISEKVELPSLDDVAQFLSRHQRQDWVAFLLDVKPALKRVKVAPAERGFSIFALADPSGARRQVVYHTCHFGCSWAAYWWSRLAAGFVRLSHRLIYHTHFGSMFVDDKLSLFPADEAAIMACLQVVLACALGTPLSWHKMLLGTFVKWIGWQLDLRGVPRAFLPEDKVIVICFALRRVCRGTPISRRELESLIGRLLWFTGGMRWLRPWRSTWFRMASKPILRFLHLDWEQVDELLELLGEDLHVCRRARFSDARCGWRLLVRWTHCAST